jgi:signal transduction histidine kinase/ligand-binding sensor domain-containing protein
VNFCRRLLIRFRWPRTTIAAALSVCLTCALVLPGAVYALDPGKYVTQYIHTSWRTQDGSLPSGMFSITQASDGFLWTLSLPGDIYRFDGVRFIPSPLASEFASGPVGKVFADHTGGLWVVAGELVHKKDSNIVSHFKLKGLHGFQSIAQDPDGSLWVALRASDAPLCHVTGSAVKCFGKNDGIGISSIDALLPDGSGGFWLGGNNTLLHWDGRALEEYPTKGQIWSLARAPNGIVWVGIQEGGAGKGLAQLKDGAVKPFITSTFDGSKFSVTSLLFDHHGNLWVGTDAKGLFRIHENAVEHYGRTDGLSGDSVWVLFEDREGIVWVGTTSGIDSFRDPRVTTYSAVEGLGKDLAAGILATRDGSIWVANNGSLDRIKDGNVSSIGQGDGLPGNQVAAMLEDHTGSMWVGVDDGLYLFKDGRFRRMAEPNGQPLGMVVGIAEDTDGNIWAERGRPRKLVRIRDFRIQEVFDESRVPPGHNLAADPHGGIWIETRNGDVVLFRKGKIETTIPLGRGGSPLNRQIIAQADGSVLVGTENGLVGWRQGNVQRMTTKNGLPCDFVITFIQDREKRWWLYTRCGIVEISDAELQRWWANPNTNVQNHMYDVFDGAQPNIGSFNAAANTPDGRVWFSSGVVVQMVDPARISQAALPASTYIDSLIVDRKELEAIDNLKLAPHPRNLQIDFTSPTFTIPQKVKFRYRLDPYDHDWHEAGTRRQAFYTDLPPGKYTFSVTAANSDGVWNETAAKLAFSVAPAYYQTNWFRALCAAVFLALLWAAYQFRVHRLQRQFEMTLDARVGERTRIARELHDTLLQSFHGLLLRFQTVFQLLPDRPIEAKEKLGSAIEQAADAITEGRDAVQGLRDSTVQGNDLALAISTLGDELATGLQDDRPAFRVTVEGESRRLHPILRDEVYKITAEALRNAFYHAQASRVEVELRYDDEQFRLRVRDNGKGIDSVILAQQAKEGHFGLHGMQERAKLMGAKLAIWSEVDAGAEVELSLPGKLAYAKERKGSWLSKKFAAKV